MADMAPHVAIAETVVCGFGATVYETLAQKSIETEGKQMALVSKLPVCVHGYAYI